MALINSRGQIIHDEWHYRSQDENVDPGARRVVIPFEAIVTQGPEVGVERPVGVYVSAGTTADQVVPFLDMLDLVVVEFPKFRDGRGFTLARALRERHAYNGDIRAIGQVLPDQFAALVQCGFSSIVTPTEHPPEQWLQRTASASPGSDQGPLLQRLIGRRAAATTDANSH